MSETEIRQRIIDAIDASNIGIDTRKGPIYDLLIRPVPPEIAAVEQEIQNVRLLFSTLIADNIENESAIQSLGRAFGVPRQEGKQARTSVVFFATSITQALVIPAGTIVSTKSNEIQYATLYQVNIDPSTAQQYFNSLNGRYEILVECQATLPGKLQEVPANTLVNLRSRIAGINGVWNPLPATNGVDADDLNQYLRTIQSSFLARDSSSFNSILQRAYQAYPNTFYNIVTPQDAEFKRAVRGDALDLIVATPLPKVHEETFEAESHTLTRNPVLQVQSIILDDVLLLPTQYEIELGEDGSTRILAPKGLKRVRYSYDEICYTLQGMFNSGNVDTKLRLAKQVKIKISAKVKNVQPSYLTGLTRAWLSSIQLGTSITTTMFNEAVLASYPEAIITITTFRKSSSSLAVETILLGKDEVVDVMSEVSFTQ